MVNKRERKRLEAEREAAKPVDAEVLQYWANHHVGGSGLSVSLQSMIKKMAREILEHRGIDIEEA